MSDKLDTVSTPSVDLSDFYHIESENLTYDDNAGLTNALREATYSTHSTQVGAHMLGMSAWNKPAYDRVTTGERYHAETLVLLHCARVGLRTQGQTLYAPWASCLACAMNIQAAGVSRVVVCRALMEKTPERWLTSVGKGLSLLYNSGVRVEVVDYNFGIKIRMDGKDVEV